MTCIASLQTLWNPPHRYKWPSSIIHIYSQCHYTVTFFFITNKTLGNPLPHQSETELQSKIQIKLSLSLSLSQPKKKNPNTAATKNCERFERYRIMRFGKRTGNRRFRWARTRNSTNSGGNSAKRSQKWIGTELRPKNGAVSWKNESDSWGNSVRKIEIFRRNENGCKKVYWVRVKS